MFCMQCEQTMVTPVSKGCIFAQGMCGKTAEVSDLQDILIKYLQGISFWATLAHRYNYYHSDIDRWCVQAFFATLTNVNFDRNRFYEFIKTARQYREILKHEAQALITKNNDRLPAITQAASIDLPENLEEMNTILPSLLSQDHLETDINGLYLLCLYGLKGTAAYIEHAEVLHQSNQEIYRTFHQIMAYLGNNPDNPEELLHTALKIGQLNYQVMALLDKGETTRFGDPVPTVVNTAKVAGKCILVSGHDMEDLHDILTQTEGTGINVYTHGEMLPAHGYPELKKFSHLVGNYGSAWQNQQKEFAMFPGAIVMTSNCIINPDVGRYKARIFTRSIVGWPEVTHLPGRDFSQVIDCAQALEGFKETEPEHNITVGFGRVALTNAAPAVIKAIKDGDINHIFLVGGCDGDKKERSYYTDFSQKTPQSTLILTLGCGKYRINDYDYGNINGIPRLLDVGQCNDAFAAIQLATALAQEFNCSVNELPLTLVISWFEQKAIAILLTLLSLGIRGIYLGPTIPAFLTPNLVDILVKTYDIHPITTPDEDLNSILAS